MTPTITYASENMANAWEKAIAQANSITLPDALWERPQVQGITIDGPTSKDLDDAIWIEESPTGATASIHITDVAELVAIGTVLDKIALARTQTRYFAQGNDPMLPHALSEDMLSLMEGQRRPTLTIQIELNEQAEIGDTQIFESWLISSKRFSYEQADRCCQKKTAPFHDPLKLCQIWAQKLNQERQSKGAIGGFFSQSGILFDENGNMVISDKPLFHSQMLIQEFMILANRAVAHWFAERDILALYRNHTARAIAPDRADMMQALLTTGNMELVRQKLQNWLNRAEYHPTLIGHFALNLTAYCHFTSPIRRLADLINHRILKAVLHKQPHPYQKFELEQLCNHISAVTLDNENAVKEIHRNRTQQDFQQKLQNTEALTTLSQKEFGNVLKHAARQDNFEPILEASKVRLEQGLLTIQDLYFLLIHTNNSEIQKLVLENLKHKVHEATSLLEIAVTQEPTWTTFDCLEGFSSSPFLTWVVVQISEKRLTTQHPAEAGKKQRSRHLAALKWLEAFIKDELVTPEQREIPIPPVVEEKKKKSKESPTPKAEPKVVPTKKELRTKKILSKEFTDSLNLVGLLQELAQTNGWDLPEFDFTQTDEGFCCTCQVMVTDRPEIIAGEQIITGQAIASKKQRAKHLAAKNVLEELQKRFG